MVGGADGDGDASVPDDAPEHADPASKKRIRHERRTTGSVG
jgi:hypothetical protein